MSATSAREAEPVPLAGDVPDEPAGGHEPQAAKLAAETAQAVRAEDEALHPPSDESIAETAADSSGVAPAPSQREREQAASRIRESVILPPYLRERLAALVEASGAAVGGQTSVPIDEAIRVLEESLPDFVRHGGQSASRPEHPAGDVFFSGGDGNLSDAQAEEIARQQLARSGLLRGQRARVAD